MEELYNKAHLKDTKSVQHAFEERAKMNSLAAQGKWNKELEKAA